MSDRPPHWAKPLCADDVVEVFPEMRAPYVKMCPRRTHLAHMKAVATRMDYAKAGVETAKTASWSPAASRPARTASGTKYHGTPAGACDAFLADCQLVHDNCVLFNGGPETPLGTVARDFLKRASLAVRELADRYTGSPTPALNLPSSQEEARGSAVGTRAAAAAAASSSTLPTQKSTLTAPAAAAPSIRTRNAAAAAATAAPVQPQQQAPATTGARQLRGSGPQPIATPQLPAKRERAPQPPTPQQRRPEQPQPPPPEVKTVPVPEPPRLPAAKPKPAPPREQYPVALAVPQVLRAALVAEQVSQFGSSNGTASTASPPIVPADQTATADGAEESFASYRKALAASADAAVTTADAVLRAFIVHVKQHGAPANSPVKLEQRPEANDALMKDAAECVEVIDRVLRPAFNRCVYNCALFPRERVRVLAAAAATLPEKGSTDGSASSSPASMMAALSQGRVDLTAVLGVPPLVRFLVLLPSIAAKVLDVSLPAGGGSRGTGVVSRLVVPVVEALLGFIATTQAPYATPCDGGDAA
jgi:hypothetical protein